VTAQILITRSPTAMPAHLDRNRMVSDDMQPAPTNRAIRPANAKGEDVPRGRTLVMPALHSTFSRESWA